MNANMKSIRANAPARPGDTAGDLDDRMRPLTPAEKECKELVYQRLLKVMDLSLISSLPEREARSQIRAICERLLNEEQAPLALSSRQTVVKRIEDEVLGLGPLEPLLCDKTVSDILVNGSNQVYVERRGKLELTDVRFNNDAHLLNIIDRIVSAVGRRIDESSPMVDARLKDGSRVNAVIPPLALDGPSLSIRRFAVELLSMDDLTRLGTLTADLARVLNAIVTGRLNVLISGGTGAGKTTLLNLLSSTWCAWKLVPRISKDAAQLLSGIWCAIVCACGPTGS
jgi:pilus assembly protein CpaF